MKKLLLLLAAGAVAVSANAQQLATKSATMLKGMEATKAATLDSKTFNFTNTPSPSHMKTTVGGSRWYNFVDLLILFGSDATNNWGRSFMTSKTESLAFFGATAGTDTVFLTSYAQVLDPSTNMFNDPGLVPQIGNQIAIKTEAYTLDSVRVYGEYRRVQNQVDTLRVAIVYGGGANTNIPIYYFTGMMANFGSDTVRYAQVVHDTVRNMAGKAAAANPNVVVRDIILDASSADDTVSDPNSNYGGLHTFAVSAGGMNIPSGQLVAASVTFIPGGSQPNWDTVSTAAGDKYNHWRAWFFTEKTNAFRTYTPGDWNVGLTKYHQSFENASWRGFYIPAYAFNGPVWHENALIDFKLTCATCLNIVSVKDVTITDVKAYPNPADETLNIPVTLNKASDVQVNLVNSVGAVVATKNVTKASGTVNVTFSTKGLASGVYFYSVNANGHTVSNRVMIAH